MSEFHYHKLNAQKQHIIRVPKQRPDEGSGLFGLGMHLTENNIITRIDPAGAIYRSYRHIVKVGMQLTHIHDMKLNTKNNATRVLQNVQTLLTVPRTYYMLTFQDV